MWSVWKTESGFTFASRKLFNIAIDSKDGGDFASEMRPDSGISFPIINLFAPKLALQPRLVKTSAIFWAYLWASESVYCAKILTLLVSSALAIIKGFKEAIILFSSSGVIVLSALVILIEARLEFNNTLLTSVATLFASAKVVLVSFRMAVELELPAISRASVAVFLTASKFDLVSESAAAVCFKRFDKSPEADISFVKSRWDWVSSLSALSAHNWEAIAPKRAKIGIAHSNTSFEAARAFLLPFDSRTFSRCSACSWRA